jgi:hypothetical protein
MFNKQSTPTFDNKTHCNYYAILYIIKFFTNFVNRFCINREFFIIQELL